MSIPNFISLGRLLTVPLLVWLLLENHMVFAFWVFVGAGISDAIDGYIAKRFNLVTVLGKFLDPLADKAVLVSVYITLGNIGLLESWLVIIVVFRDVLIIGGAIIYEMLTRSLTMEPTLISKINTVAQISLVIIVIGADAFAINNDWLVGAMGLIVAATTLLSGGIYLVGWGRRAASM